MKIKHRRVCAPPTEPGWYYAQIETKVGPIQPVRVIVDSDSARYRLLVPGKHRNFTLNQFRWFGPVPSVEEKV